MVLPTMSFDGTNFFRSIRTDMDSNRGMAGGNDNGLQFVVMDAAFYRLEIFLRDDNRTFTETALRLDPSICVVTNGSHTNEYNHLRLGRTDWQGEVIINGTIPRPGNPPSYPRHYFIGRENAIPIWRYHSGRCDPSTFSPSLQFALGRLLPLIQGGTPYCSLSLQPWPGCIQATSMTQWFSYSASKGKVGAGIHRASGCLFVFCQEDGASPGMDVRTLIGRMIRMGVDDAVLGDGSTSACLVVDQTVHARPNDWAGVKNRSITTGLMFRLMPLGFGSGAKFIVNGGTDAQFLNMFPVGTVLENMTGTITPGISGLELIIDSFGVVPGYTHDQVAAEMGIALPVNLIAAGTDLTNGETFSSISPNLTISLTLTQLPGQIDGLEGTLELTNDRGTITGTLELPI